MDQIEEEQIPKNGYNAIASKIYGILGLWNIKLFDLLDLLDLPKLTFLIKHCIALH